MHLKILITFFSVFSFVKFFPRLTASHTRTCRKDIFEKVLLSLKILTELRIFNHLTPFFSDLIKNNVIILLVADHVLYNIQVTMIYYTRLKDSRLFL